MEMSIPKFVGRSSTAWPAAAQAAVAAVAESWMPSGMHQLDSLLDSVESVDDGTTTSTAAPASSPHTHSHTNHTHAHTHTHSHSSLTPERREQLVEGARNLLKQLCVQGSIVQAPVGVAVDTNNDGRFDKWAMPLTAEMEDVVGVDTNGDGRVDSFAVPIDTTSE